MTDSRPGDRDRTQPEPAEPAADTSSPAGNYGDYEGPGAWGPAALWLLGTLFALSAAATVHSILVTFGA